MGRLTELIRSPVVAINKAKKEKSINKTLGILIITWILFGLSVFAFSFKMFTIFISFGLAITIFLLGILGSMFFGYLIEIIMSILGGKGKYYEGLTSITYATFPISVGFIITALFSLIHPIMGIVGFVIIAITAALGLSIYFKSVKELFVTDMITTFIGFLIIVYVFVIAVYATILLSASEFLPIFKGLATSSV